jgi:iron(III) transport system substrate-binding protein
MKNRLLAAGLAAIIGVTLGGASGHAADSAQSVYEKAKAEGKVVVWSSLEIGLQQKLAAKFAERYPGISLEPFRIQPGPSVERAVTEARAGRVSVDALDMNVAYLPLLLDRDLVEPYPYTKTFGTPASQVLFDDRAVVIGQYDQPIAYNTNLVKPGEIKSWDDLLDPKWRGKILLEGRGFPLAVLASKWGAEKTVDYIHKLLANKPIIMKGAQGTAEALAGGQGAIAIGTYAARIELYKKDGAPVDWARIGPIPAQLVVIVPMKGAPHPNAAHLWVSFWATPEAQKIFYEDQRYGLVKGDNLSPRGEEIQKAGLDVVLDSLDLEKGRQLLQLVGKTIGSMQ